MSMYRKSPPEYHALVVDNELDFRNELIYVVESLDIGISVTGEAKDYDSALELLDAQRFDLLIADINLTDQPRFKVGERDGTALAAHARRTQQMPCIFLTAFGDHDPKVAERASACEPIGFIRKQFGNIGPAMQDLIRLAMRHLDLSRSEREYAQQLRAVVRHIGDALLYLDGDGLILDFDERMPELLGQAPDNLLDQHWEDVLFAGMTDTPSQQALRDLIESGLSGRLPALALCRPDGSQLLASAYVSPAEHLREQCSLVVLRDLSGDMTLSPPEQRVEGATIAVFGLSSSPEQGDASAVQLQVAMLALRAGLAARARSGDILGSPSPLTLAVQLPETDPGSGLAAISTLLVDLQQTVQREQATLTLHAGIATRDDARSPISALAAAIDALDRAQRSGEPVQCAAAYPLVERPLHPIAEPPPEGTNLARAFAFTQGILDITPEQARTADALAACIEGCLPGFHVLSELVLLRVSRDRRLQVAARRNLAAPPTATDRTARNLSPGLRRLVERFDFDTLPDLSFEHFGKQGVIVFALRRHQRISGLCLGLLDSARPLRPPRLVEEHLARIGGEHLAYLLEAVHEFPPLAAPAGDGMGGAYNLHGLGAYQTAVDDVRWYLALDIPVAIVGETGMAKTQLARIALEDDTAPLAAEPTILDGETLTTHEHGRELQRALLRDTGALVIRNPQAMHPELQRDLGHALRTRTLPAGTPACALPRTRYLLIMPRPPAALVDSGELDAGLAAALGAATVNLRPLRSDREQLTKHAHFLLAAECAVQGRGTVRFAPEADKAIREHDWPGNLRELHDRLGAALRRAPRDEISALDLNLFRLSAISRLGESPIVASAAGTPDLGALAPHLDRVLDIVCRLNDPPCVGHWAADDVVELTLQRFSSDRAPLQRGAEYLAVSEHDLQRLLQRAGGSAGARQSAGYWQSARLSLRSRVLDGGYFVHDFRDGLNRCILSLLAARAELVPTEKGARIAGYDLEHYRRDLRELQVSH